MANLLIVSADPKSVEIITVLAAPAALRVRSVVSAEKAREWIPMQDFDVVLVDARYGSGIPLDLIQLAWNKNNFTIAGLFNFYGEIVDEWAARVMGARVFPEKTAKDGIDQLFQSLPEMLPLNMEYGVLVVEDLDSPRDIICSYIEALGYSNVTGAASAKEATAILQEKPNDYFTVVSDINMPDVNGIEFVKQVRGNKLLCHVPVIMLTANGTAENLLECVRAGATGFVVKPPHKKTLKRELEKARRIFITRQPARLCRPEDAHLLEDALRGITGG